MVHGGSVLNDFVANMRVENERNSMDLTVNKDGKSTVNPDGFGTGNPMRNRWKSKITSFIVHTD